MANQIYSAFMMPESKCKNEKFYRFLCSYDFIKNCVCMLIEQLQIIFCTIRMELSRARIHLLDVIIVIAVVEVVVETIVVLLAGVNVVVVVETIVVLLVGFVVVLLVETTVVLLVGAVAVVVVETIVVLLMRRVVVLAVKMVSLVVVDPKIFTSSILLRIFEMKSIKAT